MEIEFQSWGKIPRLNREMVLTEKIDGTQAAIGIRYVPTADLIAGTWPIDVGTLINVAPDETYCVYAQSRNRLIDPKHDNHGFAKWVWDNAEDLVTTLGEGIHYGEWWGSGIQRGYGLAKGEKRFSLFNVKRWEFLNDPTVHGFPGMYCVPVIYRGPFSTLAVDVEIESLRITGSLAAPGYMNPEGIVVYHTAANSMFKVTLDNDEKPKSMSMNPNKDPNESTATGLYQLIHTEMKLVAA
jgi:RNA ligase